MVVLFWNKIWLCHLKITFLCSHNCPLGEWIVVRMDRMDEWIVCSAGLAG